MRADIQQIVDDFQSIYNDLNAISEELVQELETSVNDCEHIDRITTRPKTLTSFKEKACKMKDNQLKYENPVKEIQDLIGCRIVVYYKNDIQIIANKIEEYFRRIEKIKIIPDDENEFGYEGLHYILFIPSNIYNKYKTNSLIPSFFELQIKTLYQHAWAQAEHAIGYKPGISIDSHSRRLLAFISAQSWGADEMLENLRIQLLDEKKRNN